MLRFRSWMPYLRLEGLIRVVCLVFSFGRGVADCRLVLGGDKLDGASGVTYSVKPAFSCSNRKLEARISYSSCSLDFRNLSSTTAFCEEGGKADLLAGERLSLVAGPKEVWPNFVWMFIGGLSALWVGDISCGHW